MEPEAQDEDGAAADERLTNGLAHPQRARILAELNKRTRSPEGFSEALHGSLSMVTYHFEVLTRHGCLRIANDAEATGDEDPKKG